MNNNLVKDLIEWLALKYVFFNQIKKTLLNSTVKLFCKFIKYFNIIIREVKFQEGKNKE